MSPEEMEAKRKVEKDEAKKAEASGDGSSVTKSEMMSEMRSMIQELIGLGLIGGKADAGVSKLKLELVPNDVKLEGSKNYLSWSKRVRVLLGGKGVEHYLEETCVEPADKLSTEWRNWHATNSVIVAWLLASMSPTVSKRVETMRTASQIWRTLSNIYSRKGNVMMMMMEIQSKADAVKQGGRSVEQYASELQCLWEELDHYAPLQMETPRDAQVVHKWVEDRRVTHFLKNLDHEFESRRATFCHQESLPTMDEAVAAMIDEESRLRLMSTNNPVKSAYTTVAERECFNCGEKGHLSYNCPSPRNYGGRSRTRGGCGGGRGDRGGARVGRGGGRVGGRGRGRGGPLANVAALESGSSVSTASTEDVPSRLDWRTG
jgi:uncharacterized membrane protein YgcG